MIERPLVGDPDGMEALAARLKLTADKIASTGRGLTQRMETVTFVGPAGDRFRERVDEKRSLANNLAGDAMELANTLMRAASQARAELSAWEAMMRSHGDSEDRS